MFKQSVGQIPLIPPAMPTLHVAALVEGGHGFVGGPCLNLHEVGAVVFTSGARLVCGIHILPGSSTAQDVVDFFQFGIFSAGDLPRHIVDVGTRGTTEAVSVWTFLHNQHIGTSRAEHQHFSCLYKVVYFTEKFSSYSS